MAKVIQIHQQIVCVKLKDLRFSTVITINQSSAQKHHPPLQHQVLKVINLVIITKQVTSPKNLEDEQLQVITLQQVPQPQQIPKQSTHQA